MVEKLHWSHWDKDENKRFIILTDMENEPDDSQTMVKLLMYSNEIDIEGLIAVTSCWLKNDVFPESINDRVRAYGLVRNNLMKHANNWPEEEFLLSKIAGGQKDFGMADVGDGKSTNGSNLIIKAVDKDDPRPIYFSINAGANTLAQSLWDIKRNRTLDEVKRFTSKLRVFDDSGQDDAGAWIAHTFPDLFYVRNYPQVYGLFGPEFHIGPQPWEPLDQFDWAAKHICTRHGVLGALYPQRIIKKGPLHLPMFMDGGGTTGVIGLVNKGLFDPEQISWGGWGGRFSWEKQSIQAGENVRYPPPGLFNEEPYKPFAMYPCAPDTWYDKTEKILYEDNFYAPLWRWRKDILLDFQARMDWCVVPYGNANHHPIAALFGDTSRTILQVQANAGAVIDLDASASYDPDGDSIDFVWYLYPEAGTYKGQMKIDRANSSISAFTIPDDAKGTTLHVILEVSDNSKIVPLKAYRRIIIDVK